MMAFRHILSALIIILIVEQAFFDAANLKENTLIQGKNGEELVLTKKGQVMGKSEFNATGGNSVLLKEYHRKSDSLAQWQINKTANIMDYANGEELWHFQWDQIFENIDIKGAVLDASFNITDKDNVKLSKALVGVREILSNLQKKGLNLKVLRMGGGIVLLKSLQHCSNIMD